MSIATGIREAFVVIYSSGISDFQSMSQIIYAIILPLAFFMIFSLPGLTLLILSTIRVRFWRKMG